MDEILFIPTLLCSVTSILSCCSKSLLASDGSIDGAHSGGNWGHNGVLDDPQTDMIASCDMDFQRASSRSTNLQTSTLSVG